MKLDEAAKAAREYLDPESVDLIVYPEGSLEGAVAAMIGWACFGEDCKFKAVPWGQTDDLLLKYLSFKNVLFIGCALSKDRLALARKEAAKKICILDFYEESMKELHGVEGCFIAPGASPALLAWKFFVEDASPPSFVAWTADRSAELGPEVYCAVLDRHPTLNFRELEQYIDEKPFIELITHGFNLTFSRDSHKLKAAAPKGDQEEEDKLEMSFVKLGL